MLCVKSDQSSKNIFTAATALLFVAASALGVLLYLKNDEYIALQNTHSALIATTTARISNLESQLGITQSELHRATSTNEELARTLQEEQGRNDEFAAQIDEISDTVGILDKLSKTDEELLQKYSKVSFLNEHYVPSDLSKIDKKWLYDESLTKEIHSKVEPFLEDMLEDALDDGVKIWVVSAYRSFGEQANLKGAYTVTYGSGANTFSADQGYSEHQLGTTIDFTTEGINGGLSGFGNTEAYQWLLDNAHKYGFTLSYDEENGYYVFEPWHWRFVGEDLAEDLHDDGAHFYDWDQRKIDEYLISIFD